MPALPPPVPAYNPNQQPTEPVNGSPEGTPQTTWIIDQNLYNMLYGGSILAPTITWVPVPPQYPYMVGPRGVGETLAG